MWKVVLTQYPAGQEQVRPPLLKLLLTKSSGRPSSVVCGKKGSRCEKTARRDGPQNEEPTRVQASMRTLRGEVERLGPMLGGIPSKSVP